MKSRETLKGLRGKSRPELEKELKEYRNRLWKLGGELVVGKVKNVREIRAVKRAIAQVLTLLKEQDYAKEN